MSIYLVLKDTEKFRTKSAFQNSLVWKQISIEVVFIARRSTMHKKRPHLIATLFEQKPEY